VEAEERARERDDVERERRDAPASAPGERDADVERERCSHHPGRAAVARCASCERALCLGCAVPVRGRVIGPECLAEELGDPGLVVPPEPQDAGRAAWVTVAGTIVAVLGTAAPWTRTGAGNRPFGAWVPTMRWSVVAALAAVALLAIVWWIGRRDARATSLALALAVVALAASILAIALPPTFQTASWGAWVTAAGSAIAAPAIAWSLRERPGQPQGV
jgi:hypothetical protein